MNISGIILKKSSINCVCRDSYALFVFFLVFEHFSMFQEVLAQ